MSEKGDGPRDQRERMWIFEREYSRRAVLRGAAGAGAAFGLGAFLAACGGGGGGGEAAETTAAAATSAADTGAPAQTAAATTEAASGVKTGGTLRLAHVGGGKNESLNPARGSTFIDASRYYNIYDPLTRVNPDFSLSPGLALEWTPNTDSTVWEVKLRPDVVWHDGSPFSADDVIWTMQQMGDPEHIAHTSVTNIQLDGVTKVDDLTLTIPLKNSATRLFDSFVQQNTVIVKNGETDFTKPIGTGPFMVVEFTPGQRSVAERNPNYWEEGKPYVDAWEDISIDDPAARLNALLAGEIDGFSQIDYTQAKVQLERGEITIVDAPSTAIQVFTMAVDEPPFDDERVRQAFRLIVDRQALIDTALSGFATPGNDVTGLNLPFFLDAPVRQPDIEQAKALLKEAGQENLTVTLQTSDVVPGFVEAATLFAEQAKAAGVTVNVKKEPASAYFDTSLLYTKMTFGQSFWTVSSIPLWYEQAILSEAIWNETHWRVPETDAAVAAANAATTEDEALTAWTAIQQEQYDKGGYIVWANQNIVDAVANYVQGVVPSSFFNLGGWNYRDVWLDQ